MFSHKYLIDRQTQTIMRNHKKYIPKLLAKTSKLYEQINQNKTLDKYWKNITNVKKVYDF